jgi:hypothetical protein
VTCTGNHWTTTPKLQACKVPAPRAKNLSVSDVGAAVGHVASADSIVGTWKIATSLFATGKATCGSLPSRCMTKAILPDSSVVAAARERERGAEMTTGERGELDRAKLPSSAQAPIMDSRCLSTAVQVQLRKFQVPSSRPLARLVAHRSAPLAIAMLGSSSQRPWSDRD